MNKTLFCLFSWYVLLNPKNAFENEEVYVMSEKAASNKGILRKSDEETIPGNSI